ncbi:MAG: hypothetical protein UHK60_11210 [Acutalibacteraceae bacterium]|nr:hypothetical protein [Acutalibacteraceae bacterium]
MNNRMKFGYEDTDKKIEIDLYDLVFEIKNLSNDKIEELRNLDSNLNEVERQIEEILGNGSVEKINNKRIADGYDKMSLEVEVNILGCIFEAYAKAMTNNTIDRVSKSINDINSKVEELNNNRQQRRNNKYNRNGNYNRYNRR